MPPPAIISDAAFATEAATASGLRSDYQREHHLTQLRLRGEKVRLLYDNLWQSVLSSVVAGGLLVAAMWPVVDASVLIGWFIALTAISGLRLLLAQRFMRLPAAHQQHRRCLGWFAVGAITSGCVWGATGLLLFSNDHPEQIAALSIVLAGISAGGVTTLSSVWWVSIGFVIPILLPLKLQFLLQGSPLSVLIGLMLVLFLGLIVTTSRRFSRTIHDNIALRVSMASREAQLRESENRYRSIFQHSPLGVLHFDEQGTITDCNNKLLAILGVGRAQLIGYRMLARSADHDVAQAVNDALEKGTGYYEGTYRLPRATEGIPLRAFFNGVLSASNQMIGGVAIIEDFTERKRNEAIIYRQAYYDALTDLPNRRLFIERLESLCNEQRSEQRYGLVMFLDMDRFKLINDTMGHAAGDDLLVQVARRLELCLNEEDMAARLSGDEFVLLALFEEVSSEQLDEQAERYMRNVQQVLSEQYRLESRWLTVTPSMGYTCFNATECDHGDVLKQADIAMYQAKMEGRARLRRYQPWMSEELNKRISESVITP